MFDLETLMNSHFMNESFSYYEENKHIFIEAGKAAESAIKQYEEKKREQEKRKIIYFKKRVKHKVTYKDAAKIYWFPRKEK